MWFAAFQCLKCGHSWREQAPADAWEMACSVAASAVCPMCGVTMREGEVVLLSHRDLNFAVLNSTPYPLSALPKTHGKR